jgi:hypothetical protein
VVEDGISAKRGFQGPLFGTNREVAHGTFRDGVIRGPMGDP